MAVTAIELEQAKQQYLALSREYTERGRGRWESRLVTNNAGGAYYVYDCVVEPSMNNEELLPLSRAQDRYAMLLWDFNGGSFRPKAGTDG